MEEKQLYEQAMDLLQKARAIFENAEASAEEKEQGEKMAEDAKELKARAQKLAEIRTNAAEIAGQVKQAEAEAKAKDPQNLKFKSMGEFLTAVHAAGDVNQRFYTHPALKDQRYTDPADAVPAKHTGVTEWATKASMAEGVGATGGFLVPEEFRAELLSAVFERNSIRQRATVIPMRRTSVKIPVLNQTGTTAGQPHQFGGMTATWTEEASQKTQSDPTFRQIQLVPHKLVCYTRASDELLDDEAIGLDAFLRSPMGFSGAIAWHEEYAFLRGTGAGQPLGVINAGATITVNRQATSPSLGIVDVVNMVAKVHGDSPVWHMSRSQMANLLQLNGPSGNASYVFIPNAREGAPATLFGYPVVWTEKLPGAGTAGDVVLADWSYYLVGDRQATTIDSTNIERFQYDETSWRAVHRVDGQPWLSTYYTLADGSNTISPFVILGDKTT